MSDQTEQSTQCITNYIVALSGQPKTAELIDRYVSDPALRQHILASEAAFPAYNITVHKLVAQGDTVALCGVFQGVHRGAFAGIEPTGRRVSAPLMIFYRIRDNRIAEHWMQFDGAALVSQLTSQSTSQSTRQPLAATHA